MAIDLSNLAAVAILVHTRDRHFRTCVESLTKNPLAELTDLYVFSDGADSGDEEAVGRVRDFAKTITGFRHVVLRFRETNDFSANVHDLLMFPLKKHERVIYMEDDNVVASSFLSFINEALEEYAADKRIAGISGYAPPVDQSRFTTADVYLSKHWSFWTAAVWREKGVFDFLDVQKPYADMVKRGLERQVQQAFPGLAQGLKKMDDGVQDAPDRKLSYFLIREGLYQLRPVQSLVMNTGHDGSGLHSVRSDRFNHPPFEQPLKVQASHLTYIPRIDRRHHTFSNWRKSYRYRATKGIRRFRRRIGRLIRGQAVEAD